MTICTSMIKPVTGPYLRKGAAWAVRNERMRLSRRSFERGFGKDFRPTRNGGPRTFLPIV